MNDILNKLSEYEDFLNERSGKLVSDCDSNSFDYTDNKFNIYRQIYIETEALSVTIRSIIQRIENYNKNYNKYF